ncbi:MAG: hypothetical protein JO170_23780 [Verrucomicrobia bacterium]|nr:hypothetical protein [Verrucomicrobiota bacterium]
MLIAISFSDLISLASLLFALVGLLGTFFFFSLTQWLNAILANNAVWNALVAHDPDGKEYAPRLDCYYKAKESRSWVTVVAWVAITAFLRFIVLKMTLLASTVQAERDQITDLVLRPCQIFFGVYLLLSLVLLIVGWRKSAQVIDAFKKAG